MKKDVKLTANLATANVPMTLPEAKRMFCILGEIMVARRPEAGGGGSESEEELFVEKVRIEEVMWRGLF